jgi:hypothetical protein
MTINSETHTKTKSERKLAKLFSRIIGNGRFRTYHLGDTCLTSNSELKNYLSYVKSLVPRWPQLELLADFMEVGTIPTRWCIFPGERQENQQRYTYPVDIDGKYS